MATASVLDVFPRRPIGVKATKRDSVNIIVATVMAVAMLAFFLFFVVQDGQDLLRDTRVWRTGEPATVTNIDGYCRTWISLLPFTRCKLDVSFQHNDKVETRTFSAFLLSNVNHREDRPVVKVDPRHPGDAALSWFATEETQRWTTLALFCGMCLFTIGLISVAGWVRVRELRLYRALGREPHPVAATIVGRKLVGTPDWAWEISFCYVFNGVERKAKQRFKVIKGEHRVAPQNWLYEQPIHLGPTGNKLLALASPKGALLVKSSLEPLVLTEEEKQRIRAALPAS